MPRLILTLALLLAITASAHAQTATPDAAFVAPLTCADTYAADARRPLDAEPPEGVFPLFDFREERAFNFWSNVDDDVMGGVSASGFQKTDYGTGLFAGRLSLENNGGFASLQARFRPADLSTWRGMKLEICGDGRTYSFYLTDVHNRRINHYHEFETTAGVWQVERFDFATLDPRFFGDPIDAPALDSGQVVGMAFILQGQPGEFALEVASVSGIVDSAE
jgi:NADH dehydrogenase [ubiquinone] 1 alpha subcomplex assembly factor 1